MYFQNQFTEIQHQYSTRFSKDSFVESQLIYSQTKFSVLSHGTSLLRDSCYEFTLFDLIS